MLRIIYKRYILYVLLIYMYILLELCVVLVTVEMYSIYCIQIFRISVCNLDIGQFCWWTVQSEYRHGGLSNQGQTGSTFYSV
jgi:hypothetical protein